MRQAELKRRLDALYHHYDHRFVTPDPLEYARGQSDPADQEVVGFLASALAYGTVPQIKRSIGAVVALLGDHPAESIRRADPQETARALRSFKHRFNDGRDVACLLYFLGQMLNGHGTVEGFFKAGGSTDGQPAGAALSSFSSRALVLDHGGLYGRGSLPSKAGVRFFFSSPQDGSACKRLNLFLRWMVRREGVDLGLWRQTSPASLVVPLDAHIYTISRRIGLTKYKAPGWAMAVDITKRLQRFDPEDPVKYDFALHRLGLFRKKDEIERLR